MKKISLVGSYNLHDGYLGAAKALEKNGCQVSFVPGEKYRAESPKEKVELIIKDLKEQSPEAVLWWRAECVDDKQLAHIKKEIPVTFILFSWDDPLQWEHHKEMPNKCEILDVAFSCCMDSVLLYRKFGCNAYYCPPGFDPDIHYPEIDEDYSCDVSIVCTNFYHGSSLTKHPHISRKVLMDKIIKDLPDIDVRIYGPESFKEIYPNHYKGWISFNESRKVFTNSKINISTHIRPDGNLYINERVTQVLGSRGLLYVDRVRNIEEALGFKNGHTAVILDETSHQEQIKEILFNYDAYEEIKENGYKKALECFTWDNWANTILGNI